MTNEDIINKINSLKQQTIDLCGEINAINKTIYSKRVSIENLFKKLSLQKGQFKTNDRIMYRGELARISQRIINKNTFEIFYHIKIGDRFILNVSESDEDIDDLLESGKARREKVTSKINYFIENFDFKTRKWINKAAWEEYKKWCNENKDILIILSNSRMTGCFKPRELSAFLYEEVTVSKILLKGRNCRVCKIDYKCTWSSTYKEREIRRKKYHESKLSNHS